MWWEKFESKDEPKHEQAHSVNKENDNEKAYAMYQVNQTSDGECHGEWEMELDTGASVTFMSEREEFQEDPKEWSYLQESKVKLYSYTGNQIKVLGCSDVRVEHNGQVASRLTTDSDQGHMTISIRLEQTVNIVHKLEEVLKEFKEVFQDELGMLKGVTAKIYTDPGATLSFYSTRPIAIICIKRKNGSRSQKQGIIEPVQFSDWAAPIIPISSR